MRLTYEQHKVLAGMTVEGKVQIRNENGKILKPTPSKTWLLEVSQYIQGPQPQSPAHGDPPPDLPTNFLLGAPTASGKTQIILNLGTNITEGCLPDFGFLALVYF